MVIQCQFEMSISWFVWMNIIIGIRLVMKAERVIFFT